MQRAQQGGLPVRAALHPAGLYIALRNIGPVNLQDAFMQETIARIPGPETVLHVTREELRRAASDAAPVGIIFHVARCGSTLVSQLLKKLDDVAVYAEPQPVNEILVPPHGWPRADLVAALRALGRAFARHAGGPYVLKLSSWNTLFCDIVTDAFPETNWVLCLRDPVEVGVSLLQQPPGWLSGAAESSRGLAEMIAPDGVPGSREELVARTFGAFCAAMARLDAERGRLVAYEALPAAVWDTVAAHFSLKVDARQQARMTHAARTHAKAPPGGCRQFAPDSATKHATASPELRRAIDAFARPHLERLVRLYAR
jgi:hypothetical protein